MFDQLVVGLGVGPERAPTPAHSAIAGCLTISRASRIPYAIRASSWPPGSVK